MIATLIANILPLYGLIALGYIAGRYLDVNLHSVSRINIFILLPIVTLGAMTRVEFTPSYILVPFIVLMISLTVVLTAYRIASLFWKDGTQNLIAVSGVNGNAVYFGIPVISFLFGIEGVGLYLFLNLGAKVSNISLGYYLAARGRFSVQESIARVIKFPPLHAAWIGLLLNYCGVEMEQITERYWTYASGAIVMLGMMMIGIGISKMEKIQFSVKENIAYTLTKSVAWPLMAFAVVMLDRNIFGLFNSQIHQLFLLHSSMPVMGNLVAYASEHKLHPNRAAAAVLFSSVLVVIVIPFIYWIIQLLGI